MVFFKKRVAISPRCHHNIYISYNNHVWSPQPQCVISLRPTIYVSALTCSLVVVIEHAQEAQDTVNVLTG